MTELRSFEESDLPELAELWNHCLRGQPNFVPVVDADLRRRCVDQPSFEDTTLLVTPSASGIRGFVHFGPRTNLWHHLRERRVHPAEGHIYVLVAEDSDREVLADLLRAAARQLRDRGARRVLLGPSWVCGSQPFYNCIAGGYEIPGLSIERPGLAAVARELGFARVSEYDTPELDLRDADHMHSLRREAAEVWLRAERWSLARTDVEIAHGFFPRRRAVELVRRGELVAMTAYGPWPEYERAYGRRLYGITSVQVSPRWRGRGLGKLITIEAAMAALEEGAEAVHLHVWRDNRVAWNLYHRALGFQRKYTWVTLRKTFGGK